jgi:hypothetical protein
MVNNSSNEATETNYLKTVTRGDKVRHLCSRKYRNLFSEFEICREIWWRHESQYVVKTLSIAVDDVRLLLVKYFQKLEHTK